MGTRAMYTFADAHEEHHVYKHWDGYPSGAVEFIAAALPIAWQIPRFEPDDMAAAFIAGNKTPGGGDIRTMRSGRREDVAPGDIEFAYRITCEGGKLIVEAFATSGGYGDKPMEFNSIFRGTLDAMRKWIEAEEAKSA